ncbi:MAG: hypothetical protein WBM24_21455 [Candidatus Sulfotelmatobacter sp.]
MPLGRLLVVIVGGILAAGLLGAVLPPPQLLMFATSMAIVMVSVTETNNLRLRALRQLR